MEKIGVIAVVEDAPAYFSTMDKMNASVDSFARAGGSAGSSFQSGFGEVVTGALRHIGTLAVDALGSAAMAVGGFLKDSIGLAGDFQSGMLEFQSVAGKEVDTKGLEEFHDLFLQIGKELPVSTADVQAAAIEMVKGGIDPAIVAAGGLRQNIQFAAAAMDGDLVMAAEISSKLLGGWADANATAAEQADFLTHSTDLLTKAANASSVDVEGLSQGIFNAQGIAKTAGVSFDDLTTTLALLAPRFSSSSEAGNSLKNMIARLQPTTKPATAAMEDLGLWTERSGSAFYDAQGNFVGFEAASRLLQDSLKGLTKEQQAAALQTIFGNDAMGAAAALADGGAAAYQNMTAALENANGVQAAAALKQQGFNTALDNAKGSVEALQIQVGEYLLPILTTLLNDYIAPAINAVGDVASAFFEAGGMSSEFGESVGALATALGLPGELIQDLVFAAQDLIATIGPLVGEVSALIAQFTTSAAASDELGSTLDDLSGVWDHMLEVVETVGAGYQDIIDSVLPIVSQFIEEHGDEISAFFKKTFDTILTIIHTTLDLYLAIVPPILHGIADFIADHGDTIISYLEGAWKVISGVIDLALALIEGFVKTAMALIQGDWEGAWDAIQEMSASAVTAIIKIIEGAAQMLGDAMQLGLDAILAVWNSFTDWAGIGDGIIDGIVQGVINGAKNLAAAAADAAREALDAAKSALGISSPSKEFAKVGAESVAGWAGGMQQALPDLTNAVEAFSRATLNQARASVGRSGATRDTVRPVIGPQQLGALARGSTSNTQIINVDARGSTLTQADITRGVQAGLRAEGNNADVRIRTGAW